MTRILLLLLLAVALSFGAEQPPVDPPAVDRPAVTPKLTPAANKVIAQFEADQTKAKTEYDKKVADLKKVAAAALDKEILAATKDGNLDLAIALRTKKEEYVPPTALAVKKTEPKAVVSGKWNMVINRPNGSSSTFLLEISDNGDAFDKRDATPIIGKWSINGDNLIIVWHNSTTHTYLLSTMSGSDNNGVKLSLRRIAQ